eukprot:TRINITY_DN5264_c0_g1_i3.p1 TRINITY_DN5264_c0_g1~~TRINITY_DN5264_c0_g1_i3.p1  ORF type:complete len:266 (-),score=46.10 TRINITY_DN5264_c0_g1_i3:163-960(-)
MVYCFYFFFFFKQKTAYEMLRSLVGSEMCIRDRVSTQSTGRHSPLMPFAVENGGFLEFFLSTNDKREFVTWVEDLEDKSLSSLILNPLWNRMARLVPAELAPNVLALAGFLCVVQAWYLTIFSETHPHVVSACCVVLVCTFYCLHSMHTVHAMNTRQDTPLSEVNPSLAILLTIMFLAIWLRHGPSVGCFSGTGALYPARCQRQEHDRHPMVRGAGCPALVSAQTSFGILSWELSPVRPDWWAGGSLVSLDRGHDGSCNLRSGLG